MAWEQGRGGRGDEPGLGDTRGGASPQGPLSVPMKLGGEEHSVPGADWQKRPSRVRSGTTRGCRNILSELRALCSQQLSSQLPKWKQLNVLRWRMHG